MSGFVDHHVHFLATAAARLSVDVTAAETVEEVAAVVGAAAVGERGWVRAWGYDEAFLADGRHPTRQDLDAATDRPAVLHHRSGHAAVLNGAALAEIGEADHPDGILYDRHDLLSRVPRLDRPALSLSAASVSRQWSAAGIVAFTDATHTNGAAEIDLLAGWSSTGVVSQKVTAMVGSEHLTEAPRYGEQVGPVRIGPAKIMPREGDDVAACVTAGALVAGFPVAVHVVEIDVLEAVLAASESVPPAEGGAADRIEHNSLCLPDQLPRLAATGAVVVVNPSFLIHRRRKYQAQLTPVELGWLVRIRSLLDAGITVRAGSDSPVVPAVPEEMVAAATAHPFSPEESVDGATALRLLSPL